MKFKIERNFLVRTYEEIELDPETFISCGDIEELTNEIEDCINICEHPTHPNLESSEQLGVYFSDKSSSFYKEWQRLKGLPQEL